MKGQRKRIGKYIMFLNHRLGAGSFAEVYLGASEQSKEEVAIKVVRKQLINEDEYTKNAFYSEILINKKLKSPNIIQFYDVHETANNFYIILQLAQSGTLRDKMKKEGKFDEKKTLKYLYQLLNAFGELSKNGISHRDLKPENILVKDDLLKVADFGFSKISSSSAGYLQTIVGTPAYMSPQILNEQPYTYKCDIWSLGVMAYEMIVGRLPWILKDKTLALLKKEVMEREIEFPDKLEVSANMKNFILGCLLIDESKRFGWQQIFLHPLFEGKFDKNFSNKKENLTEINFIMSNLRLNIHSRNINISKIINSCKQKLNQLDFVNLFTYLDKEIASKEIMILFKHLSDPDGNIQTQKLVQFFIKHRCRMNGMDVSKMNSSSAMLQSKPGISILMKLKNIFEVNKVDLNKFMSSQGYEMNDELDLQAFGNIILMIYPSATAIEIRFLFNQFDYKKNKKILMKHAYWGLCKIAEIVPQ